MSSCGRSTVLAVLLVSLCASGGGGSCAGADRAGPPRRDSGHRRRSGPDLSRVHPDERILRWVRAARARSARWHGLGHPVRGVIRPRSARGRALVHRGLPGRRRVVARTRSDAHVERRSVLRHAGRAEDRRRGIPPGAARSSGTAAADRPQARACDRVLERSHARMPADVRARRSDRVGGPAGPPTWVWRRVDRPPRCRCCTSTAVPTPTCRSAEAKAWVQPTWSTHR